MFYLKNYQPPPISIEHTELKFNLDAECTQVHAKLTLVLDASVRDDLIKACSIEFDAVELKVMQCLVEGSPCSFVVMGGQCKIWLSPAQVRQWVNAETTHTVVEFFVKIYPQQNTQLSGLYCAGEHLLTQCEAQSFRRIIPYFDRPDVLSTYRVVLSADAQRYPVLLSNGNLRSEYIDAAGIRHAEFIDPAPKPCYLFAIVAGHYDCREKSIILRSGTRHTLQVYCPVGKLHQTQFALEALCAAVFWDEARFGRVLDLERFIVVATSHFNMGAMENRGLNIFDAKYLLADPATATDDDYYNIASVIAHEYLHNWSGNRVTLRDWFQLSLKEGLTVYRDQEFSLDQTQSDREVQRIKQVMTLRLNQWSEDSSPLAHAVRPNQYSAIDNLYTATVYEKGAEVVRILATLCGVDGFRAGMDIYFARHDGQAVTCEDFLQAMVDANPKLCAYQDQFMLWYEQAGTPQLSLQLHYDQSSQTFVLDVSQSAAAHLQHKRTQAWLIPLRLAALDVDGNKLSLTAHDATVEQSQDGSVLLWLTQAQQRFSFNSPAKPEALSLLRGFSAPVQLHYTQSDDALHILLQHDDDAFARWEAQQELMRRYVTACYQAVSSEDFKLPERFLQTLARLLQDPQTGAALSAVLLQLPREQEFYEVLNPVEPQRLHLARRMIMRQMAEALDGYAQTYWQQHDNHLLRPESIAERELANTLFNYALSIHAPWATKLGLMMMKQSTLMSLLAPVLKAMVVHQTPHHQEALDIFYTRFKQEELVLDQWFAFQALARDDDGKQLERVAALMQHKDFSYARPARYRSVVLNFCMNNPAAFHRADGKAYQFAMQQIVLMDAQNPLLAARLLRVFQQGHKLAHAQREQVLQTLNMLSQHQALSDDCAELLRLLHAGFTVH